MGQESTTLTERHPIGVFDSGVGGLTVVRALRTALPGEDIIYLGDTARVPYGNKSPRTVEKYSLACQKFLLDRGVKLVLIACNTASANALPALDAASLVPVIGAVEPGAASALAATRNEHLGVIGTLGTVRSNAYASAISAHAPRATLTALACPLLVPLAEEGWIDDEIATLVARRYLVELFARDPEIDTLVLGCTHYPLLRDVLRTVANDVAQHDVIVVDSASAMAEAARTALGPQAPGNRRTASGRLRLLRDRYLAARRARAAIPRRAPYRVRARGLRSYAEMPLARASSALCRFITSTTVAARTSLSPIVFSLDRIVGAEHEAVVEQLLAGLVVIEIGRELLALVGDRLERADLRLEPGHQLAHDGLAQREVRIEALRTARGTGRETPSRLPQRPRTDRLLEHDPQQDGVVGIADDRIFGVGHRVFRRYDVDGDTGGQLARGARQVLVIHRVERDLQIMWKGNEPRPHQLDELRLRIDSHGICLPRIARGLQNQLLD